MTETLSLSPTQEGGVPHLVVLVHGINTRALWMHSVGPALEDAGFKVALTGYGKFSILRFLLPFRVAHEGAIERVLRAINTAIMLYRPQRMSVISHSFGTYVVAQIMAEHPELKWDHVIFCGSVLKDDFPLFNITDRFKPPLLNEVGSRDAWPAIAESVTWGYGSVGSSGFAETPVVSRWHTGFRHSDFLTTEFCGRFWIPFLRDGTVVRGDPPTPLSWVIRVLTGLPLRWFWPLILVAVFFGAKSIVPGDIKAGKEDRERVASFTLNLPNEAFEPGKRFWSRLDNHWTERYVQGAVNLFTVEKRVVVGGCDGSVVVHEKPLEIFIPDRGCSPMTVKYRREREGLNKIFSWEPPRWNDLAVMQEIALEGALSTAGASDEARKKLQEVNQQLEALRNGKNDFVFHLLEKYRSAAAANDAATAMATWEQLQKLAETLLASAVKARNLIIDNPALNQIVPATLKSKIAASANEQSVAMQRIVDAKPPSVDDLASWEGSMRGLANQLSDQLAELNAILVGQ